MTALWTSVARAPGAALGEAPGAVPPDRADAPSASSGDACEAWWTADERYVLRVAETGGERWYVGELDATDAADAAPVEGTVPRPPREIPAPRTRTMLVGRQRGRRVAPAPMRLHVRRPTRG